MQSKSLKNAEQCYNPIITCIAQYQYNSPARLQCNFILLIWYTHTDMCIFEWSSFWNRFWGCQ